MTKEYSIKFKGKPFLLIGSKENGAIATRVQYDNFLPSYAQLYPDGKVMQYGKEIGTIADIEFLED